MDFFTRFDLETSLENILYTFGHCIPSVVPLSQPIRVGTKCLLSANSNSKQNCVDLVSNRMRGFISLLLFSFLII